MNNYLSKEPVILEVVEVDVAVVVIPVVVVTVVVVVPVVVRKGVEPVGRIKKFNF
jgi:hypothetical protein